MTDLPTLRAFVAIAREGSVSRAAERLNIPQPAVSLKLTQRPERHERRLSTRHARRLWLTADGRALLPFAETALARFAGFEQQASALHSTLPGRLRIGTSVDPEFIRLGA